VPADTVHAVTSPPPDLVVFDFDGTLVDSDEALLAPFEDLGVDRSDVVMGSAVAEECARLGISMSAYVDAYDTEVVVPFPGVEDLLAGLPRWAILSNKHPDSARAELGRLGWEPEALMCADAFGWAHKSLVPMLDALGMSAGRVAMVGDSRGDLTVAAMVGCRFVWAGWNARVQAAMAGEGLATADGPTGAPLPCEIAPAPVDVLAVLGLG
jgi:HAD superfamily hydrolase (TIGR01549 family)